LITTWFTRAWSERRDPEAAFESFVFAWIAVNAWAACVTGQDADREYMRSLSHDSGLRKAFNGLLREDQEFRQEVESFFTLLPIFKAQSLRHAGLRVDRSNSRHETVQRYFAAGTIPFEPECAKYHLDRGEAIPCDWPHFINAVYRVRCNLFHGEKAAHSEMDQKIVRSALMSLTGFFRGASILETHD